MRLKRREVVAAMGCRSFAELCEKRVGLSSSQADRLVDIVTSMTRTEALSVGATKAASTVALVRATAEVRKGKTPRGRSVTKEERASCAALEKALRAVGAKASVPWLRASSLRWM